MAHPSPPTPQSRDTADLALQLQAHGAFAHLSPEALASIAAVARPVTIQAGETIVREGETSRDLFLIVSGVAVAVRADTAGGEVVLNQVEAGDCIGELTFLDGGARSASVRAQTPCTAIMVPVDALEALPDHLTVLRELTGALASVVVRRTRHLSDTMLAALQDQLAIKALQNQFGYFLVLTISLFVVSSTLLYLVAEDYVSDVYDPGFTWQTVAFLAVPCLTMIWLMKIPARDLGLRWDGLWRSLGQSALICAALTVPVAIYVALFGSLAPADGSGSDISALFLVQYFIHCIIQEIGARGLLQNLFRKFLSDHAGHKSVALASVIFASLHMTFGLDAVLVTLVASFAFGYMYLWQKNLAGVILLHFWLGVLAAAAVAF